MEEMHDVMEFAKVAISLIAQTVGGKGERKKDLCTKARRKAQ